MYYPFVKNFSSFSVSSGDELHLHTPKRSVDGKRTRRSDVRCQVSRFTAGLCRSCSKNNRTRTSSANTKECPINLSVSILRNIAILFNNRHTLLMKWTVS